MSLCGVLPWDGSQKGIRDVNRLRQQGRFSPQITPPLSHPRPPQLEQACTPGRVLASEAFARSLLPDDPRWNTADAFVPLPSESARHTISGSSEGSRPPLFDTSSPLGRSGGSRHGGQALETALKRTLRQPSFASKETAQRSFEPGSAAAGPHAAAGRGGALASSSLGVRGAPGHAPPQGWLRRVTSLSLLGISIGAVAPALLKGPAWRLEAAAELELKGVARGPSMTFFVDLDRWPVMPVEI